MDEFDTKELVSSLVLELRRGVVILLSLGQLKTPTHGYNLVRQFQQNGIPVEANTLYPLLRRLETQGLLKSEWDTSGAKPKKFYTTTEKGVEVFKTVKKQWKEFSQNVENLLEEKDG